jgi:hypothetical protein
LWQLITYLRESFHPTTIIKEGVEDIIYNDNEAVNAIVYRDGEKVDKTLPLKR